MPVKTARVEDIDSALETGPRSTFRKMNLPAFAGYFRSPQNAGKYV